MTSPLCIRFVYWWVSTTVRCCNSSDLAHFRLQSNLHSSIGPDTSSPPVSAVGDTGEELKALYQTEVVCSNNTDSACLTCYSM
jgi:hypothetical protein